jgi:hypothetical protein
MEKAEIFSFPTVPGSGGHRQSLHNDICRRKIVEVVITLDFEVLVKKIASSEFCPTSESPT